MSRAFMTRNAQPTIRSDVSFVGRWSWTAGVLACLLFRGRTNAHDVNNPKRRHYAEAALALCWNARTARRKSILRRAGHSTSVK